MSRLIRFALMTGAALALTACASAISVSSHVDHTANFTQYKTFGWGPADALPTGDPRLDQDPFFKDHVQGAVEKALAGKGVQVAASGTPDLLIHYHANISKRIDVSGVDRKYGACTGEDCVARVTEYDAGTLVVDIVDARTNKLVWRGWAQNSVEDMLKNQDKMAERINEAVPKMLALYPKAF